MGLAVMYCIIGTGIDIVRQMMDIQGLFTAETVITIPSIAVSVTARPFAGRMRLKKCSMTLHMPCMVIRMKMTLVHQI